LSPQILSYRYKNERSVAFKIRQNPFSGPGPRWGAHAPLGSSRRAHDAPPDPLVGWRRDTPPHMPPHSARTHLRRSPFVPPEVQPDLRLSSTLKPSVPPYLPPFFPIPLPLFPSFLSLPLFPLGAHPLKPAVIEFPSGSKHSPAAKQFWCILR